MNQTTYYQQQPQPQPSYASPRPFYPQPQSAAPYPQTQPAPSYPQAPTPAAEAVAKSGAPKTLKELLESGAILKVYNKDRTFLTVSPAFDIDKVCFSVIEMGSGGKNHNDIYISTEQFRQFINEIDSYVAVQKFAADAQNASPEAYKWVTGENGSKHLAIGGGQKGARVKASIYTDGKWNNKQTIVQLTDLQQMSFLFKVVSGILPAPDTSYYGKLRNAFWAADETRKQQRRAR